MHRSYHSEYLIIYELTDNMDRASVTKGPNGIYLICSCDRIPNNVEEKNIVVQIKSVTLNLPKLNWFMKHVESS